jgi:hypothetical protein
MPAKVKTKAERPPVRKTRTKIWKPRPWKGRVPTELSEEVRTRRAPSERLGETSPRRSSFFSARARVAQAEAERASFRPALRATASRVTASQAAPDSGWRNLPDS